MNALRLPANRDSQRPSEAGLTFIELIISIVILTMITGAISAAFLTSINSSGATNARVHASNDAQVIAAFLVRDAQAAGGVDPTNPTSTGDPTLGVTLGDPTAGVTFTDPSGCGSGVLVFGFAWRDWAAPTVSHLHVVNYFYVSGTKQLTRTTCTDGVQTTPLTIGNNITSVSPSCSAAACPVVPPCTTACSVIPDSVALTVTETTASTAYPTSPYTYTLQATVRPQGQTPPSGGSTASLPTLLALGGSCPSTPGVTAAGNNTKVTVAGPTVINGADTGSCQLLSTQGGATFTSTPAPVFPPNGFLDPFLTFPPPNDPSGQPFNEQADCLGGSNPSPTTVSGVVHYQPGVYQQNLSITSAVTFDPGVYFFCSGLGMSGHGVVTANGVLFYFAQGSLTTQGANTNVTMSGLESGPDAGFVIWMPRTNNTTTLNLSGQTTINQFKGLIYVPNVDVTLGGGAGVQLGSVIAHTITFSGGGQTIIGNPPSITGPATLPDWTIGNDYGSASRPATMTATGGTTPYTWSATGLPAGLQINSSTGVIWGTPTATGTSSPIVITVTDALGLTATRNNYSITINPKPLITGPNSFPVSTQGAAYPSTTITASPGTQPLSWTASGLPAGMSINPSGANTAVISGTPAASGTFTVTVTVTDAVGVTAPRDYPLTINSPPTIGTTALPEWTQNRPYSTTVTASSGTPPYTWSATGLPNGLSIGANNGVISGTTNRTGTFPVTVTITDSVGAPATKTYSLTINPTPSITYLAASLPASTISRSYPPGGGQAVVTATGGTAPYAWSDNGTLPNGLTINSSTGVISGTPTVTGTSTVTITMTDAAGATAPRSYSLTINIAPTVNTTPLPNWTVNRPNYSATVSASGGTTPYSWAVSGMPAGLVSNPSGNSVVISGTPTQTGTFTVTTTVTDTAGATATHDFTVTITSFGSASQFLVTPSTSTPNAGSPFTVTLTAQDAAGNTVTSYTGPHTVTWGGANTSPAGNVPTYPVTSVTFASGVSSTTLTATLFSAGSNSLTASATTPTVTGSATINVNALTASHLAWTAVSNTHGTLSGVCFFTCTYTSAGGSGTTFKAKIKLTDNFGNAVNAVSALNVTVTKSAGTFAGSSTVTIPAGGSQSNSGGDATATGEITFNSESGPAWGPDTLGMTNTGGIASNASASFSR